MCGAVEGLSVLWFDVVEGGSHSFHLGLCGVLLKVTSRCANWSKELWSVCAAWSQLCGNLLCLVARLVTNARGHATCSRHFCTLRSYTSREDGSLEVKRAEAHLTWVGNVCLVEIEAVLVEADL